MNHNVSAQAAQAREQARAKDGKFGAQPHDKADGIELSGPDRDREVAIAGAIGDLDWWANEEADQWAENECPDYQDTVTVDEEHMTRCREASDAFLRENWHLVQRTTEEVRGDGYVTDDQEVASSFSQNLISDDYLPPAAGENSDDLYRRWEVVREPIRDRTRYLESATNTVRYVPELIREERGPEYERGNPYLHESRVDPALLSEDPPQDARIEDVTVARELVDARVAMGDVDTGRTGPLGHQHRVVHFTRTDRNGDEQHLAVDLHVPGSATDADPVTAMRFAFDDSQVAEMSVEDACDHFRVDVEQREARDDVSRRIAEAAFLRGELRRFWGERFEGIDQVFEV